MSSVRCLYDRERATYFAQKRRSLAYLRPTQTQIRLPSPTPKFSHHQTVFPAYNTFVYTNALPSCNSMVNHCTSIPLQTSGPAILGSSGAFSLTVAASRPTSASICELTTFASIPFPCTSFADSGAGSASASAASSSGSMAF